MSIAKKGLDPTVLSVRLTERAIGPAARLRLAIKTPWLPLTETDVVDHHENSSSTPAINCHPTTDLIVLPPQRNLSEYLLPIPAEK